MIEVDTDLFWCDQKCDTCTIRFRCFTESWSLCFTFDTVCGMELEKLTYPYCVNEKLEDVLKDPKVREHYEKLNCR